MEEVTQAQAPAESEKNAFLGEGNLKKLMLKFSIPCVLSLVISALYNIVDQIFVGNSELSILGNAATGIVFPIFIISQAFAWCLGDGSAAYMNIRQGKGDSKGVDRTIGNALMLTLLCSALLMAVFFPLKRQLLTVFGASENTIGLAIEYFNIILAFFPFYMLMNMMNAVVRADGSPAWSMASMLTGAVVNIILDPVFIFGCKWGMSGAAWATVIGQCASFIISFVYFFRTKTFRLNLKSFIPDKSVLTVLKLGLSSFVTQLTIVVISLVCNILLKTYGGLSPYGEDIPIAVIAVESKVFTVVINIVVGIVLGCQPIISYNLSAKKYDRVRKLYRYILVCTVAIGLFFTILFEACPGAVVGIFGKPRADLNPDMYWKFGKLTFRIFLMLVTLNCVVKMTSIFFQAVGKPVFATVASLVRDIVCFIPLILLFAHCFGIEGILWASPVADFCAVIVAVGLTVAFFRSLKKEEKALAESVAEEEKKEEVAQAE